MTTPPRPFDVEAGFRYASRLRGPASEINEPGWSVDWEDAPWPFKIYEGGRRIQLPVAGPPWGPAIEAEPAALGRALHLSVGCTRIRVRPDGMVHSTPDRPAINPGATLIARRAIASGGALYPAEVYVCAAGEALPGTYHYDPARHELVELSAERPDARLAQALGLPDAAGRTVLVVTDFFWKNFCKYGDFGYRLSAVDVGIAVARLHRLAEAELGEAIVCFDFDDLALNNALGVEGADESAYAAIVVSRRAAVAGQAPAPGSPAARQEAPREAPPKAKQKSRTIKRSKIFDDMHASVLAGGRQESSPAEEALLEPSRGADPGSVVALPPGAAIADLRDAVFRRTSNGELFTGKGVPAEALSTVLAETAAAVARVRRAASSGDLPSATVWAVVQRVAGVPAGAYRRDETTGGLVLVRGGDLGLELQACSNVQNINLDLGAFSVHVIDRLDFRRSRRGNRTYRIQQMLAGAALDGAMLACAALGLGCHPMLGFNAARVDALYGLTDTGHGALAQICVGVSCHGHHMEGNVAP